MKTINPDAGNADLARRWRDGWRRLGRLGLLVGAAGLALLAAAQPEPLRGWPDRDRVTRYWADERGTATLDEARAAFKGGQGTPVKPHQIMPLGGDRAIWYQIDLSAVSVPVRAVLTLPVPGLDKVELHRPDGRGGWQVQRSGDFLPVAQWPIRYLYPAFVFTVSPGEAQSSTYLKVQHGHPIAADIELSDSIDFEEASKAWHLVLGAYVGVIVLVVLLSIAHAVFWRDPIHVYYAIHVILIALAMLALTGAAGEYLWPRNPWWNDIASAVLPAAALAWLGLLVRELVAERGRRLLSWLLLLQAGLSLTFTAAFLALGREPVFLPHNLHALVSFVLFLGVAAWYALRRPQVGLWVLAGLALLAAGSILTVLRNLGLELAGFASPYALPIGGALEVPLLLVGLYFRGRERRDNKLRIDALARTDPLTGVGSHRVLIGQLEHLLERNRRDRLSGAVLRVHVANLKVIVEEYGREAAAATMVRAAECVAMEAREGDTVARDQVGDLVLLLEGRLTREQATAAARNIIARGLKFSGRLPPGVTLTLHVAGACAPLPECNGQALLGTLGDVLQDIARDPSGRALRILKSAEVSTEPDNLSRHRG
ncbi:MAG TPA: 7TM diverse intracellular signaling domain-containing protein [Ramlibacter sp.]|nr:7TM diverse intracellular signaling domain-containing protein [Ramlibacter sp.]